MSNTTYTFATTNQSPVRFTNDPSQPSMWDASPAPHSQKEPDPEERRMFGNKIRKLIATFKAARDA